jgi:hypothetical protein
MAAHDLSRRAFLAGVVVSAAAIGNRKEAVASTRPRIGATRLRSDVGSSSFGAAGSVEPRPIEKRVEKLYKIAGCTQPNDLQFTAATSVRASCGTATRQAAGSAAWGRENHREAREIRDSPCDSFSKVSTGRFGR